MRFAKIFGVCVMLMATLSSAAADDDATMRELERQIEQARMQLDEAAQRIAALYTEKYGQKGAPKKAMLGILLDDEASTTGVEIVGVTPGGGAEAAGLTAGDLIVRIGEEDLTSARSPMRALSSYMKGVAPGEQVFVEFERGGETLAVDITTQAHGAKVWVSALDDLKNMDLDMDFDFSALPGGMHHKVISQTEIGSKQLMFVDGELARYFDVDSGVVLLAPPADSRLQPGDVLLSVDGQSIDSMEAAVKALDGMDEQGTVQIQRHGRKRSVEVAAGELALRHTNKRVIKIKRPDGTKLEETIVEVTD